MRRVRLLKGANRGEVGTVVYASSNDGFPVVKVRLDSGTHLMLFLDEFEAI